MASVSLDNKIVLITGAARRIGRGLALACAKVGADVVVHFHESENDALQTQREVRDLGRRAWVLQADLEKPEQALSLLKSSAGFGDLFALVNNAAVFDERSMRETSFAEWQRHLAINLTAPFLLSREFAGQLGPRTPGRIVNMLDWRAIRPDDQHFAYSVSKAALAAVTRSLAVALAPTITVNGLALGAILPPEGRTAEKGLVSRVPAGRWGSLSDVEAALVFLLTGPAYLTGEIIHIDGGRHLL